MAARATQHSAQVLRAWQSALPTPPAHRRPIVSSLIWSLSSPSASLPYLKPTPWPTPALSQVAKRGMATLSKAKNFKSQESEDESLARFHRAIRDESESTIDMWSLPLETLESRTPDLIFQTKSTKDDAWVAPLRGIILENYRRVNNAIADGDSKAIASLTTGEYAKSALRKLRSLHSAGSTAAYRWRLVSQPSPVCIISIRAIDGHLSLQPLRAGNPLYVNVLARFETIQSLTRRGVASTTEPKRVVEHLLFEKRMWYDTPWVIKEQLYVDR
ncbi:hypothetical protein EDB86DRAFT_3073196 [Lactarius hatsudake]|nr:hypothetical protein EDB86DRAFT_3073196 [Lactarius hatsudake]